MKHSTFFGVVVSASLVVVCGCEGPQEPTPQAEQALPELTPVVAKQALVEMFSSIQGKEGHDDFAKMNLADFANAPIRVEENACYIDGYTIGLKAKKYSIGFGNRTEHYHITFGGSFELKDGRWTATVVRKLAES